MTWELPRPDSVEALRTKLYRPHLTCQSGVWFCRLGTDVGFGPTPKRAYESWKSMRRYHPLSPWRLTGEIGLNR